MGLIDTSQTETLEHPYEPGEWVTIRPMLAPEMDEAQEKRAKHMMAVYGDLIEGMTRNQAAGPASPQTPANRVAAYDADVLLTHAITAWSYAAPVEPESIERLDAGTRAWLAEEIVLRNTRPLAT